MYTCLICHALNHASRLHCQACGTIPAMYSITGFSCKSEGPERHSGPGEFHAYSSSGFAYVPSVSAIGVVRTGEERIQRVSLRTVPIDYYATE